MEETLLAFAPAILAVAVAVFLHVRRSIKEASDETTTLQKGSPSLSSALADWNGHKRRPRTKSATFGSARQLRCAP